MIHRNKIVVKSNSPALNSSEKMSLKDYKKVILSIYALKLKIPLDSIYKTL